MAKRPTVTTISSGYASNTQLNANFEALRDAFDNTLSIDGSTPNAMNADLDMNSNDIINVDNIDVENITIAGKTYTTAISEALDAAQLAVDSAASAEDSAVNAALYDPTLRYDSFSDLIADVRTFTAGTTLTIPSIGAVYQATAVTGNLGQTNVGGQEFDVLPDGGVYQVKAFGATGAGIVTDSPAIDKALIAAAGNTLEFGDGVFMVSKVHRVPTNTTLIANGAIIEIDPRNYTGEITRFWGVFSTVDIADRPQVILWRIGTGAQTYKNIKISGFTFNLNRDGTTLTTDQMDIAEFNAIRFEDALNCYAEDCRFIDGQTIANNNGTPVVFIVRSEACRIINCYFEASGAAVYLAEGRRNEVSRCTIIDSAGTAIESVGGSGHIIKDNYVNIVWWTVSTIGINTPRAIITGNLVEAASLTGITIGHEGDLPANFYNISGKASYTVCTKNRINSGSTLSATSGQQGIRVQGGNHIRITDNIVLDLVKAATHDAVRGGIVIQGPGVAEDFTDIVVDGNIVAGATTGFSNSTQGDRFTISNNDFSDVLGGIYFASTSASPSISMHGNRIKDASVRGFTFSNGFVEMHSNYIKNAPSSFWTRGTFDIHGNTFEECGEMTALIVKMFRFVGNTFIKAAPVTRAVGLDNSSSAGTATIDLIECYGNYCPGATDVFRITNVLNQTTRVLNNTKPTVFRTTSYNVGTLPTSATGLVAGDLWNNAGVVTVV